VIIDRDAGVYPMVPPGMTYDQMITGDWIPSRVKNTEEEVDSSSMF
jgi:acetolactate synthase-1/2/3 large subunit